jgi:hypothetical protein
VPTAAVDLDQTEQLATDRLAREVAALRRELAQVRRDNRRLRTEVFGADRHAAEQAGWRFPPDATTDARLAGLDERVTNVLIDGVAEGVGVIRQELEERIAVLERRPELRFLGLHNPSVEYAPGSLVRRQGRLWLCTAAAPTREVPGKDCSCWSVVVVDGRDGRDRDGRDRSPQEPAAT